jgi:hypothetical protein
LVGGSLVTFFVARYYYYVRASKDLLAETKRLRNIVNLLAGGLINAGLFEGKFDPETGDLSLITVSTSLELRWRTDANEQRPEGESDATDG